MAHEYAIELPPTVQEALVRAGREDLVMQYSKLDTAKNKETMWGTLKKWGKRVLWIGSILALGHSAGLWAKLGPWAGELGAAAGGWFGLSEGGRAAGTKVLEGVDAGGKYFGKGAAYFWNHLKGGWNSLTGNKAEFVPSIGEKAHDLAVGGIKKFGTDKIPMPGSMPPPAGPPAPTK